MKSMEQIKQELEENIQLMEKMAFEQRAQPFAHCLGAALMNLMEAIEQCDRS